VNTRIPLRQSVHAFGEKRDQKEALANTAARRTRRSGDEHTTTSADDPFGESPMQRISDVTSRLAGVGTDDPTVRPPRSARIRWDFAA
jgi:hypothetical protein